ncbi:DUF6907 domain-containing protein [Streptomyces sp. NPDC021218]|uniref:DUF6907 domain-containing protein n=1 Tax=Streptomyces sp. NPDC021218 TaxID=3365119 RepID=UPI0037A715DA
MKNLTRASEAAPSDRPVPAMVTATAPMLPPCVYCKKPGTTAHTSQKGDPFATCAECTGPHLASLTPEYAAALSATAQSVQITAPGRTESLITAELFTSSDPDDSRTVATVYGSWDSDADLDSVGLGQLIASTEGALPGLRALRDQLAAIERGNPAAPSVEPRTFTFPLRDGGTLTETCPRGCTADHQPQTERREHAEDIWHHIGDDPHLTLTVFDPDGGKAEDRFLFAQVTVAPHAKEPQLRVPHVNVEIAQDYSVMEGLGPDELAAVIGKLATHVEHLRSVHARLVQARADWQARA